MSLNPVPTRRKSTLRDFYRQGRRSLIQAWRPVRNRIPVLTPYRKAEIHVVREGALGDVLMATPALRRVKELNPKCRVTFYTHFANLVRGLTFIDEVLPVDVAPTGKAILLRYENLIPVRRHIAGIFGEILGVDIRNTRPSCVLDPRLHDHYRQEFRELPRPWIIVNRKAATWSPNKNWPDEYWGDLLDRLTARFSVVEIGASAQDRGVQPDDHYLDLRGKTALEELVAAIGAADLHVGPVSGPVHIAAAVGTPRLSSTAGMSIPRARDTPGTSISIPPCPGALLVDRALPVWPPVSAPDHSAAGGGGPKQLWEHKNQAGRQARAAGATRMTTTRPSR